MHEDVYTDCTWKNLYTDDSLPLKKNLTARYETDHTALTGKVNVETTGLPISADGGTCIITGSHIDTVILTH